MNPNGAPQQGQAAPTQQFQGQQPVHQTGQMQQMPAQNFAPPQPQYQPQQQQQQQQFAPPEQFQIPAPQITMPAVAPNPLMQQGQHNPMLQQQPQQQQQAAPQQQTSPYEAFYADYAQRANVPVESVRAFFRDDPRVISANLAEATQLIQQQRMAQQQIALPQGQQQQQQQQPAQPSIQKYQLPAGIENVYIRRNEQTGLWEGITPAYRQYADAANHNEVIDRSQAQTFMKNPTAIFQQPEVAAMFQEQVRREVAEATRQIQESAIIDSFRAKHGPEIIQVNPQTGQPLNDLTGKPLFTPLGLAVDRNIRAMQRAGMKDMQLMLDTALASARWELAQSQQQGQQFQPQQFQQQPQPQYQPQYQQPVVQAQQPGLANIYQQSLQAATYFPGNAPPRQGDNQHMTFEGQLLQSIKDIPDGLTVDAYWPAEGLFGRR